MSDRAATLVIGGHGHIGEAICHRLVRRGDFVVSTYRSRQAPSLDGYAETALKSVPLECTDENAFAQLVEGLGIDEYDQRHLIISLGIAPEPHAIENVSIEECRATLESNVLAIVIACKHFSRIICAGSASSITIISSIFGVRTPPCRSVYGSSKHALKGLLESLSVELGPKNCRVNLVSPGPVASPMLSRAWDAHAASIGVSVEEYAASKLRDIPLGRLCSVDDVAAAVDYITSSNASYISGIDLVLSGGWR